MLYVPEVDCPGLTTEFLQEPCWALKVEASFFASADSRKGWQPTADSLLDNEGHTPSFEGKYELVLLVCHAKLKSANQKHLSAHGLSSSRASAYQTML